MNLEHKQKQNRFNRYWKENIENDCWEWIGGKNNVGYGMFRDGPGMRTAHRVSYELYKGTIPKGQHVCHTCDNPKCVNPEHLWLGTHQQNMLDSKIKGRRSTMMFNNCKHCGLYTSILLLTRWHNDRCKQKPLTK